jgi:hypothetical protein
MSTIDEARRFQLKVRADGSMRFDGGDRSVLPGDVAIASDTLREAWMGTPEWTAAARRVLEYADLLEIDIVGVRPKL